MTCQNYKQVKPDHEDQLSQKGGQYGVLVKSEAKDLMTTEHVAAECCFLLPLSSIQVTKPENVKYGNLKKQNC
ncbi:hypothetical protein GJ744_000341 [Endocarpon pusillum]|uniref:Uncharacterized protein n=1 Tax=Endocarpon pusillum TaxID=364733 RepID=A0A8H7AR26_9EURO|nr:hypothetical protein GJ744_000341 [Endocarpon pusillum]